MWDYRNKPTPWPPTFFSFRVYFSKVVQITLAFARLQFRISWGVTLSSKLETLQMHGCKASLEINFPAGGRKDMQAFSALEENRKGHLSRLGNFEFDVIPF